MALLDEEFDVPNEEGTKLPSLLPAGTYTAELMCAEVGPTKSGRGQQIRFQWTITEGPHEKRVLFQNVLIKHDSEDAMRFGRQCLKDICAACGINEKVQDLDVLLFKPCSIKVVIDKDKNGEYPDRNKIVRVKPKLRQDPLPQQTPINKELNDPVPFN
jgi:hypothetical protein